MVRLFFVLSGENSTLPYAEIKAILETENISYSDVIKFPQVLSIDTSEKSTIEINMKIEPKRKFINSLTITSRVSLILKIQYNAQIIVLINANNTPIRSTDPNPLKLPLVKIIKTPT